MKGKVLGYRASVIRTCMSPGVAIIRVRSWIRECYCLLEVGPFVTGDVGEVGGCCWLLSSSVCD